MLRFRMFVRVKRYFNFHVDNGNEKLTFRRLQSIRNYWTFNNLLNFHCKTLLIFHLNYKFNSPYQCLKIVRPVHYI